MQSSLLELVTQALVAQALRQAAARVAGLAPAAARRAWTLQGNARQAVHPFEGSAPHKRGKGLTAGHHPPHHLHLLLLLLVVVMLMLVLVRVVA